MYKLSTAVQVVKITPQDAEGLLKYNTFQGQRQIDILTVRSYAQQIKLGLMRVVPIAIATLRDGSRVLMNGQHSLSAIILADKTHLATIEYYKCELDSDVWELFASFDVGRSRSQRQVLNGARHLLGDVRLREMPFRLLEVCGTALLMTEPKYPKFDLQRNIDKRQRIHALDTKPDEVCWIYKTAGDCGWMLTVGVVCAILKTLRANPDKAATFWNAVRSGLNIKSKMDPVYMLREDLRSGNRSHFHQRTRIQQEYILCICWWNAWVSGDARRSVKIAAMKTLPDVLS